MRKRHIPSIGELQAFTSCARLGTTTLAALELNLTQSAVSRALGTLEARLGVALFERARQRLSLAPAGAAFLPKALQLLKELDEAAISTMAFGGASSVLRIATLPSFGRHWLIPRLARLARAEPRFSFDISVRLKAVDFAREPFDLAIMRKAHQPAGSVMEPLLAERLILVCHADLLGPQGALTEAELLERPLLQQSTRPSLWLDWFKETDTPPRAALRGARADHFDMVLDMAEAGMGVGLVPEILARPLIAQGRLARAHPREMLTGEDYVLIRPFERMSAACETLRDALKSD